MLCSQTWHGWPAQALMSRVDSDTLSMPRPWMYEHCNLLSCAEPCIIVKNGIDFTCLRNTFTLMVGASFYMNKPQLLFHAWEGSSTVPKSGVESIRHEQPQSLPTACFAFVSSARQEMKCEGRTWLRMHHVGLPCPPANDYYLLHVSSFEG